MTRFLTCLVLFASALTAQTVAPAATGSVSGRVFDADTNLPVSDARVGSQQLGWVGTNEEGRYTIPNLAAGTVRIGIQGDRGEMLDSIPVVPKIVTVSAGRDAPNADFHVRIEAYISGRVLDASGNPLSGIRVTVFNREYRLRGDGGAFINADQLLNSSNSGFSTVSDDRGVYTFRIPILAGRSYWIFAERERTQSGAISDVPADPKSRRPVLASTFYPNAKSLAAATPILLHSHEHRDNLDIHMPSEPSYCVEADVKAAGTAQRLQAVIESEDMSAIHSTLFYPRKGVDIGTGGAVRICDLYSGRFQLSIIGSGVPNIPDFFATLPVSISDADVRGISVTALPPSLIPGEVIWDGIPAVNSAALKLGITPYPLFSLMDRSRLSVPFDFVLPAIASLPYSIQVSGLTAPYYVKDILRDGVSVRNRSFIPGNGNGKLQVIIGRDSGTITSQIDNFDARTMSECAVLILPVSAESDGEMAINLTEGQPDESGHFVATGLPPGKYYVLALSNPPPHVVARSTLLGAELLIEKTPETLSLLRTARTRATLVEVTPGGNTQAHLIAK